MGTDARFQLQRELGAGAMGVVYEATDTHTGGRVAVKKLTLGEPEAIARFKNEFRALADVAHPNLVSLYELVVDDDNLALSMELIEGCDLQSWLRPCDRMPRRSATPKSGETTTLPTSADTATTVVSEQDSAVTATERDGATAPPHAVGTSPGRPAPGLPDLRRVRDAFSQLASGISAIHRQGMLHRDLKPSNVLVTPEGRVVVLDFGIITSLRQAATSDPRKVLGTPAYMAPEQAAGLELTPAADWYSVGVMLYRALCGRLPFTGRSQAVMSAKQRSDAPPVELQVEGLPGDLAGLCNRLLARDPRSRPSAQEICRVFGGAPAEVPWLTAATLSGGELVGRDVEFERLRAIARPRGDGARLGIVSGASGLGKSRLLGELADAVRAERDSEQLLVVGRCRERESIAFKALDQIVDLLVSYLATLPGDELERLTPDDADALASLFPVFRRLASFAARGRAPAGLASAEVRRRSFLAFRRLVFSISQRRPLTFVIDDVQWGDEDSAQLLVELARGPASPRLSIVVAHRDEDESDFVAAIEKLATRESLPVERVDLAPLDRDSAVGLARGCLGDRPDADAKARRIADEANGNPLFIEELSHHASFDESDVDLSLEGVLRARIARLPDAAARLLEYIAVPGQLVPLSTVIRAAGHDDPSALGILRAGSFVRARQLRGERAVECYHGRIRDLLTRDLTEARRREVNGQWVQALEQLPGPDPELLAALSDGAGDPATAAKHWLAAARRAEEGLAFVQAARLFGRAVDRFDVGSDAWQDATIAMANCYRTAGRGREAARAFTAAAGQSAGYTALELERLAVDSLLKSGAAEEGLRRCEDLLAKLGHRMPKSKLGLLTRYMRARLKVRLRGLSPTLRGEDEIPRARLLELDVLTTLAEGVAMAEPLLSAATESEVVAMALELGEPARLARALLGEAAVTSLRGPSGRPRTARVLALMEKLVDDDGRPELRGHLLLAEAWSAFQEGRWPASVANAMRALEIYRNHCVGVSYEVSLANQFACFSLAFAGRTADVERYLDETLRDARERGDIFTEVNILVGLESHECIRRGNPEGAYRVVDEALAKWSPRGFQLQHYNALFARLSADLHRGDFDRAEERIRERWPALENSLLMRVQVLRCLAWDLRGRLVVARVDAGDLEGAARAAHLKLARQIGARLEREHATYANAMGRSLRAAAAFLDGDHVAGLSMLEEARDLYIAAEMPQWAAAAEVAQLRLEDTPDARAAVEGTYASMLEQRLNEPQRAAYAVVPGFGVVARRQQRRPR